MPPNAVPEQFTTVLSEDQVVVHVAQVEELSPLLLSEHRTLCGRPVVCQVSAQAFHRKGCTACAVAAVGEGVISIADRRQATINLPRFLAAMRSRAVTTQRGMVPGQRGFEDHPPG